MFRFAAKRLVLWPVTLKQMTASGDGMENGSFYLLLEPLTRGENRKLHANTLEKMLTRVKGMIANGAKPEEYEALAAETERVERDHEAVLLEKVRGWRDVTDEDGQPVEFTRERFAALIEYPDAYQAALAALAEATKEALAKNSQPGPAGK